MILSNEPGYYLPGAHGIRLENLLLVQPAELPGASKPFLRFETLTLAPFDRRLIDPALLDAGELAWLNAYHARVLREVGPRLEAADARLAGRACAPLSAGAADVPSLPHRRCDATIVSDGPLTLPRAAKIFRGPDAAALDAAVTAAGQTTDAVRVEQNCLLLDTGGKRVLFDNGMGSEKLFGPDSGQLLGSLGEAGGSRHRSTRWC